MSQNSLWQSQKQNNDFAEICNALYERELRLLANANIDSVQKIQGRIKSLSYYINRTANLMTQVHQQGGSPLTLDIQNASWSAKQAAKLPLNNQSTDDVCSWYLSDKLVLGLVVPIVNSQHISLDCIDRIDDQNRRIHTNTLGWFSLMPPSNEDGKKTSRLLKPNKKVMLAACAGHTWQHHDSTMKLRPAMLSLRELLVSCAINWKDFKQPLAL